MNRDRSQAAKPGAARENSRPAGGILQRQAAIPAASYAGGVPPVVHEVLSSPGQPLDPSTRADMEGRFGHDFSGVRVHTDAWAAESANAVNAHAYTVRNAIAFNDGRYDPGSETGQRLLAHELAHVVQQRDAPGMLQTRLRVGERDTPAEREAATAADRVLNNEPVEIPPHPLVLARDGGGDNIKDAGAIAGVPETKTDTPVVDPPKVTTEAAAPPRVEVKPKGGNTIEVWVNNLHLATIHYSDTDSDGKDYKVGAIYDAEGKPLVYVQVSANSKVDDHNPLGDGPQRVIWMNVIHRKPVAAKSSPAQSAPPKKPPADTKASKQDAAPAPQATADNGPSAADLDLILNPYTEMLAEQRAKDVRDLLPWYTYNAAEKILDVFQSCTPEEFQQLQEKLGGDMEEVIDKLDPFSAVRLGAMGPVVFGQDALNRKRAEYVVDSTLDFGVAPAQVLLQHMFSGMYTDDIRAVLQLLADDRYLKRTILDPGMKALQKYLTDRGIDLSQYVDRGFGAGDVGRAVWEFGSRDIWDKTVFADARYGRLNYQTGKLPKAYSELAMSAYYGQYYSDLKLSDLVYGTVDYVTLGIPLGFYGAAKGAVEGGKDIATGNPDKGIKEIIPALIMLLSMFGAKAARGRTAPEGGGAAAPEGLVGPEGKGQFSLPNYEGPVSPEAARVGALLNLNPEVQGAGGILLQRLGPEGVNQAAGYVQNSAAAARFVVKGGMPALEALVQAKGDVAAAEAILAKPKTGAPPQLPPGPKFPEPGSGYSTSAGEINELKKQRAYHPNATILVDKFPGGDMVDTSKSGTVREWLSTEKKGKDSIVVRNIGIKGGLWISLKTIFVATLKNIKENVNVALKKFKTSIANQPKLREATPSESPNIYRRIHMEGIPDRITIHLDLDTAVLTDEMVDAARDAIINFEGLSELPPLDLIFTDQHGNTVTRSFEALQKQERGK